MIELVEASIQRGHGLMASYGWVARKMAVSEDTVKKYWKEYRSTAKLATRKIQAKSSAIVETVLKEASPGELIDLLSRPNIGVLEPMRQGNQGSGFIVSVSADSCGGVKVGVASGDMVPQLPEGPSVLGANAPETLLIEESYGEPRATSEEADSDSRPQSPRDRLKAARAKLRAGLDAGRPAGDAVRAQGQDREWAGEGLEDRAPIGDGRQRRAGQGARQQRLQGADVQAPTRALSTGGKHSKIVLRDDHESFR